MKIMKKKLIKQISAIALAICMAFPVLTTPVSAISESELEQATVLEYEEKVYKRCVYGEFSNADDENWYQFTLHEPLEFRFCLSEDPDRENESIQDGWKIEVYREGNLEEPAAVFDEFEYEDYTKKISLGTGRFFVKVGQSEGYDLTGTPYEMFLDVKGLDIENNDSMETANVMRFNVQYRGSMKEKGDLDYYKITVPEKGAIYYEIERRGMEPGEEWGIKIYDPDGKEIKIGDVHPRGYNYHSDYEYHSCDYYDYYPLDQSSYIPVEEGTYYLCVEGYDGCYPENGEYFLEAFYTDENWELEDNDTPETANRIEFHEYYYGIDSSENDVDWFKIFIPAKGEFGAYATYGNYDLYGDDPNYCKIGIYDKNKKLVKKTNGYYQLAKGTYYIRVVPPGLDSCIPELSDKYELGTYFRKAPSKPTNFKVTALKKGASLKWKKVSSAYGYEIYRATSKNGKYKRVKRITHGGISSYKNTGLKSKKRYYYKIRAYKDMGSHKLYSYFTSPVKVKTK